MELVVKNYRSFPDSKPIRLQIDGDLVAFVGVNNAGKSSLLRLPHELRHIFGTALHNLKVTRRASAYSPATAQTWLHNRNDRSLTIELHKEGYEWAMRIRIDRSGNMRCDYFTNSGGAEPWFDSQKSGFEGQGKSGHHDHFISTVRDLCDSMFVPSFRSMRGPGGRHFDVGLGAEFIRQWDELKRGSDRQAHERIEVVTEEVARLLGSSKLQIDSSRNHDDFVLLDNGKSYGLDEVGAGMAHCIIALTSAAMFQPSFLCIDEPEAGLHPSLQIEFLTTLGRFAARGIWFATHSYGLARSVASRMYAVRRYGNESEMLEWNDTPNLAVQLGELSYGSYLALGGAKILLVEGPTEIKCYQHFLRMLGKDQQVIVLGMFGRQFIDGERQAELSEVKRISPNVYAIIDSEITTEGEKLEQKRLDFLKACSALKITAHVLMKRATENYLPDRAAKAVNSSYRGLGPYDKPNKGQPEWWGKDNNWRIAQEMTKDELLATDLGNFLASI